MELTMHSEGKFWDKIADRYASRPIGDLDSYERKLEETARYLRPDMKVLEFGCGTGGTALHHAGRVSLVHGVDISPRMVEHAESKRREAGIDNAKFSVGELDTFDPGNERYDAVLAMSLLQVVSDRDEALASIRALLRPGDLFVSSTMCIGDDIKVFKYIAPIGRALGFFPIVRVFTSKALRQSITTAGFDIVRFWKPGRGKATFVIATAR